MSVYRFCVAPMMDGTDRHCRYFHRLMTKNAYLYSEMVTAEAVIYGDQQRLLGFDPTEQPVALQLGGSDPEKLSEAARIGEQFGYLEVNLNVGCPSDRVQSGAFGACLMKSPDLVAACIERMQKAVSIPVTVKCRIGVDDQDPERALVDFVDIVAGAGCDTFIVHARKAWLQGLSPKENRDVPPLDYGLVAQLKHSRPDLIIVLNGGIETIDACRDHLSIFDGVMLGREAYGNPYILAQVDRELFGDKSPALSRAEIAEKMTDYLAKMSARGEIPHHATRHMLGLYQGQVGARLWRRTISELGRSADSTVLQSALEAVSRVKVVL